MDKDLIGNGESHLGDGRERLKDLEKECLERGGAVTRRIPLFTRKGEAVEGGAAGCFVEVELELGGADKARATEEHKLYEYERWDPLNGWSSEHLLPTDPGRWSTHDSQNFSQDLENLILPLTPGWAVETEWEITGRQGSPMAWEFAGGFRPSSWQDEESAMCRVRRRMWRRIMVNNNKVRS